MRGDASRGQGRRAQQRGSRRGRGLNRGNLNRINSGVSPLNRSMVS